MCLCCKNQFLLARTHSLPQMAPECFSEHVCEYSEAADVYSLGMVLWELAARAFPFKVLLLLMLSHTNTNKITT